MQVRPDQLTSALDRGIAPVYLICGEEPLQKMESADLVRRHCKERDYLEREVIEVDSNFDWHLLKEEAASMSLFSSRRVLDLRIPSAKPGRDGGQALREYAQEPPQDTVLLITAGKIEKSAKSSAWFKSLDAAGVVVQCWPVSVEQLPSWVNHRFRQKGLIPDKEAVSFVCQHVEGNLLAANQEIEKLLLMLGPGEVTFEAIKESITQSSRFNMFELIDCALRGDQKRVVRIVDGLKSEGTEPIIIIWGLTKDVRLLCQSSENPATAEMLLRRSGVWQNRIRLYTTCLSRHNKQTFYKMLQQCEALDRISKGMKVGDIWDEILQCCYQLAGRTNKT